MSIFAAANISEWRGFEIIEADFLNSVDNSMTLIATRDLFGGHLAWSALLLDMINQQGAECRGISDFVRQRSGRAWNKKGLR